MPSLNVDGLSIRYLTNLAEGDKGNADKQIIVLFHGDAFSLDNWKEIGTLDLLEKERYSFLALDLPSGKGSKSTNVQRERVSEYVPILHEIFSKLGIINSPLIIVGPSMGGGFALAYALAHSDSLAGLVLISPSLRTLDESEFERLNEVPILLLWGEKDKVFSLDESGRSLKNQLPRSKLLVIKGAGHAAYLDKPDEFHELLLDFLSEVTG